MNKFNSTLRWLRMLALSALFGALVSCVTTTTGGFNVDTSEGQAVEDYIQLALGYYDAGDMSGARRNANNALEIDSRHSDAHNILALIFQTEGDLDLAEEYFQRAISLDRDNSRARNNYAAMLFTAARYREAYEQLQRVTQDVNYESRSVAFENLGRAALRIDRSDDAIVAFQRALQLNSNLYISSLELAILETERQNWQAARNYFRQYTTTVDFLQIPHTPRALLAGIRIEQQFQNEDLVRRFSLILSTLYQDSPEYLMYQRMIDAN